MDRESGINRKLNLNKGPNFTRMTGMDQFLWNLANDQDLLCIWAIAILEEPLKDYLIKKSLEYLIKTIPILNSKPIVNWLYGKWQFIEKTNAEDLIIRINAKTDEETGEQLHKIFLNPINAKAFSMIRLISIDGPSKHYFVIQVHHLAVDGEGLKRICVRFAEIYQELYENKEWKPSQILDPCRSWQQITKNFNLRHLFFIIKSFITNTISGMIASATRNRARYKIIGDVRCDYMKDFREPPYFEAITIDNEIMLKLKAFTKNQHCTVNDVLMSSLSLATMEWNRDRGDDRDFLRFGYAVNLRRWWGEPSGTFGNFINIAIHDEIIENLRTSSSALKCTKSKTDKLKKTIGLDGFFIMMQLKLIPYFFISRLTLMFKEKIFEFIRNIQGMTNIGIIFEEAGDFGHTKVIEYSFLAPTFPGGGIVYTITTYKNKTTIYLGSSEDYLIKTSARSFLRLWKRMILKVISAEDMERL